MLKLYPSHWRCFNHSSLIILLSLGRVTQLLFFVSPASKPQMLNDLPKISKICFSQGKAELLQIFKRSTPRALQEPFLWRRIQFPIMLNFFTVLRKILSSLFFTVQSDSSFTEILLDCISDSYIRWQTSPTSPPCLTGCILYSSFILFFRLMLKTVVDCHYPNIHYNTSLAKYLMVSS